AAEDVVLAIFVAGMVFTDMRWRRIPNFVTYPTMLLGLAFAIFESFPNAFVDRVVAIVAVFAIGYPIVAGRMLKSGDVKFLMAVGALRGTGFVLFSALYGSPVGGLIALLYVALPRLAPTPHRARPSLAARRRSSS